MEDHPLAPPPAGSEALRLFLSHFGISRAAPSEDLLLQVSTAFSRLPYENLTKILKLEREGSAERARRWPEELIAEHVALGAGGTCFSLTAALLHLLRALGWRAEPVLADRHYGPATHCALLVWIDGAPRLLDPGYLILKPIPLGSAEVRISTAFNEVSLAPRGADRLDLFTRTEGEPSKRLTYRTSPADPGEFLRAWDASFGWDMMTYPLLTRVAGDRQVYLQKTRLQIRGRESTARSEVSAEDLPSRIAREFGVDASLAARALAVLSRKGEGLGAGRAR